MKVFAEHVGDDVLEQQAFGFDARIPVGFDEPYFVVIIYHEI